jgi:hypothetical protein
VLVGRIRKATSRSSSTAKPAISCSTRVSAQDFFEVDPARHASALGEDGLAAYRDAVAARRDGDSFAARYSRERLAISTVTSTRRSGCSVGT